jgi:hypothetical protein
MKMILHHERRRNLSNRPPQRMARKGDPPNIMHARFLQKFLEKLLGKIKKAIVAPSR